MVMVCDGDGDGVPLYIKVKERSSLVYIRDSDFQKLHKYVIWD